MKILLPILFAAIAAIGNGIFAYGQKKSTGFDNGLFFVAGSALVACLLALAFSPLMGGFNLSEGIRSYWKALLFSGGGLFLTYIGFNLLYTRFGVSPYVLYAVISIITTTIIVGAFWLKEPINLYHKIAISLALISVIFYSIGQSKL